MKYDAFISYRRENGFLMAQVLHDRLKQRGVSCYLDLEETASGKFNEALIRAIHDSSNFILVLPPKALNRCRYKTDWVRREILAAVEAGKNIIPIMYDGFRWPSPWPEEIPTEIQSIENQQGVMGTQEYLSAMIDKIIHLMVGLDPSVVHIHENAKNVLPETTTEFFSYYLDKCGDNITGVDMAFHAGAEWTNDSMKLELLRKMLQQKIPLRILVNSASAAETICSHMTQPLKRYVGFDECAKNWKKLEFDFPVLMQVRVLHDIPLLHRLYLIRSSNRDSAVSIKYYTYGNYIPDNDFRTTIPEPSRDYYLYQKEFDYLWEYAGSAEVPSVTE